MSCALSHSLSLRDTLSLTLSCGLSLYSLSLSTLMSSFLAVTTLWVCSYGGCWAQDSRSFIEFFRDSAEKDHSAAAAYPS